MGRWLLILSQNGLKDLRLSFLRECKVPSSLFSCHILENLAISGCTINAPQCFQGLKLLRRLKLTECNLVGITLEKFISSCPLLESLGLFVFVEYGCLTIRAPHLKQLKLLTSFADLLLETPKLISASIFFSYSYQNFGRENFGCKRKLLGTIGRLSNIEELGLNVGAYLASGPIPVKLPVTFHHLKKISIELNDKSEELEAALCILRNAPILKTLYLNVPSENIWGEQRITTSSLFKQLEVVEVISFTDDVSMLAFAKFILSTAPHLEKLVIDDDSICNLNDDEAFLMKLESFPKLSSKAVILYDCNLGCEFMEEI
ncbi:hypothetical protein LUZ63_000559 [Rhynchospora breviuscula]|uniref:FBD domain-containing protein n=1 Tax=Rhynchospora breviuscula TaxID=2022672 RepID=A0A9Q0CVA0_9POAL|nr:hypothetical protein LUZ63_000559 [Rhynchospora breviuscula]